MQADNATAPAGASSAESLDAQKSDNVLEYVEALLTPGQSKDSSPATPDSRSVAKHFEGKWESALLSCTCSCASELPNSGLSGALCPEDVESCSEVARVLKLQAAWHTQCLKLERFGFVADSCRAMCRWARKHECSGGRLVRRYVQEMQRVCWGLHGFQLDIG
jgi:hypothetical protein